MKNWLEYLTDEDVYKFVCTHFDSTCYVHDFEEFKNRIKRTSDEQTGKFKILVYLDQGNFKRYNATFCMNPFHCNIQDGMAHHWYNSSKEYKFKSTKNKDLTEMVYVDYIKLMISKCGKEYEEEYKLKIIEELNRLKVSHQVYVNEIVKSVGRRFTNQLQDTQDEEKIKVLKQTQLKVVGSGVEKVNLKYEKKYKAIDERFTKIFGKSIFESTIKKPQAQISL